MLKYPGARIGARLARLVSHDDAKREYACRPEPGRRATQGRHHEALAELEA